MTLMQLQQPTVELSMERQGSNQSNSSSDSFHSGIRVEKKKEVVKEVVVRGSQEPKEARESGRSRNYVTKPFATSFNSKLSVPQDRLDNEAYDPSTAKDDVAAGSPAHRRPIAERRQGGAHKKSLSVPAEKAGEKQWNSDEDIKNSLSDEGSFGGGKGSRQGLVQMLKMPKQQWALRNIYAVIPGRFYFTVSNQSLRAKSKMEQIYFEEGQYTFFTSNLPAQYFPFCSDYGPTNLGVLYRFVDFMDKKMKSEPNGKLCFRVSENVAIRTNAAFLMAAFLMVRQGYSPEEAWEPFASIEPLPFTTYRDATFAKADFTINILDCLQGLQRAMQLGWFDMETFPVDDYEHFDHPDNGDLHFLCPKAMGFKGPMDPLHASPDDISQEAKFYVPIFKKKKVSAVVRLNNANTYNANAFKNSGIGHYDLYFDDCTTPTNAIVQKFFDIVDSEKGVVAVHCKAGLGRTGTLIGLWLMKNYGFKAKEVIAWMRLCRPGSVIGPQQHFLQAWEMRQMQEQSTSSSGPGSPSGLRTKLYTAIENSSMTEDSEMLARQVSNGSNNRAAKLKGMSAASESRAKFGSTRTVSADDMDGYTNVKYESSLSSPFPRGNSESTKDSLSSPKSSAKGSEKTEKALRQSSSTSSLRRLGQFFRRSKADEPAAQ